ncbi:bifunctional molybdenum cofactor biosynthesis protein MoaC/MoaB [Flavobacterium subsaxonicum]|uniref:Molybdopterin adenylyltransferase n=1 Tax=Flavobacterium subsaxonicum WB 4.1-42 = DSM 21790 TaxID=1121898 RepID=A0A0A2MS86_9FLAO|nr:bifunctional molybdenum cofactor biosynthesis protein MoaC/MoaB [Flavobacterium subsaxonicum]KGO91110.1 molybdopterin-guanine dinucleotide biosynthesis protein MoaC [Flavobacterium subsaxonicum WB 4.1-42 = DSM 21790]
MVDITHKSYTLRKAIATATVLTSQQATIDAIEQRKVPKGDIFEFSRAAALFAIKKTSDVIPDCHPLPVEYAAITYKVEGLSVIISVEVHTIYKTGVEVEAMHGASVAALVMYDMLKPIDKHVEIQNIRLQEKHGGKSDSKKYADKGLKCAVVVCSDTAYRSEKEDTSGKAIVSILEKQGLTDVEYTIIPDDFDTIQTTLKNYMTQSKDLVIFTGGTGLSARDVTPQAVEPLIDTHIPGIMETARAYGQQRIKTAMLSRGVAGFAADTLVITLPGSKKGAQETMEALFPQVLHVFDVRENRPH